MMVSTRKCDCLMPVANLIYKDTLFHFSCFNAVDKDDSSVGLMGGQLRIPGSLLRKHVFDPVVNQVCFYRSSFCFSFFIVLMHRTTGPYLD